MGRTRTSLGITLRDRNEIRDTMRQVGTQRDELETRAGLDLGTKSRGGGNSLGETSYYRGTIYMRSGSHGRTIGKIHGLSTKEGWPSGQVAKIM